ncbi:hypothetical protein CPB85DRAFT_1313453, partial [Mucidula mucida]
SLMEPRERVAGSSLASTIWTLEKSDKRKKWVTATFISIASILFMFDIAVPPGKKLVAEYEEHLISYPKPFEWSITPHSPVKAQMAQARAAQCYI